MLLGYSFLHLSVLMLLGVLLDALLGEVRRAHPLVGFGRYAAWLEQRMNLAPESAHALLRGLCAWGLAVLPFVGLAGLFSMTRMAHTAWWGDALQVLALYFAIGLRSLRDHTLPIAQALAAHDLPQARQLTSRIVSRNTASANEGDLAKATVESLLENGNDAVFAALFWFVLAGAPGVVLYRLSNTLDAMWGYRTPRFERFGKFAARCDDALNYLPARLTALTYALLGHTRNALHSWRTQAPQWDSPNAGPVMSAGAGALQLAIGGAATYHGQVEQRPLLGCGASACADDIPRAWRLVWHGVALWCGAVLSFSALNHLLQWRGL